MCAKAEIALFLNNFKEKMAIWDVLFRDDRGKNTQALIDLELRPIDRLAVLRALDVVDYSEGPLEDKLNNGPPMWVFGKTIKQQEVYIKISMGLWGRSVICISFNIAEKVMLYPLK